MKAIKTNSGSRGVISNMVPSLQHVYTVSILLGKVEYVARQNVYDKSERKQISKRVFLLPIIFSCLFKIYLIRTSKRNGIDCDLRPIANTVIHQHKSELNLKNLKPMLHLNKAKVLFIICLIGFTVNGKKQR
jgi:hypothetical protein